MAGYGHYGFNTHSPTRAPWERTASTAENHAQGLRFADNAAAAATPRPSTNPPAKRRPFCAAAARPSGPRRRAARSSGVPALSLLGQLEAEEARWLYSACPPDDDEMNCG